MGKESNRKRELRRLLMRLSRFWRHESSRYCAIALCASLIAGNLGHMAAAASEEPDFRFELERQALSDALQEAIAKGEPVSSDFGFEGAEADMYKLSMPTDETLYELMPETAYNEGDLQLRIFVHLENSELINDLVPEGEIAQIEEFTESHNSESTGSENIFFLLINKSDQAQTAVIRIDDKESEWILVEPYSAVEMPEQEGESGGPGVSGPGAAAENGSTSEQQPEVNSASGVITSGSENSGSSGGSSGGSSSGGGSSEKTEDESVTESESSPAVDEKFPAESESSPEVDEETSIENESAGAEQPAEDDAGEEIDTPEIEIPEIDVPETDAPSVDIPENNTPDIDVPETDEPEIHIETDTPETDESDVPEIEIPESDEPDDANDIEDTNDTEMDTSENSSEVEILDDSEDVNDISAETNDAENTDTTSNGSDKSDGHEGGDTAELSATVSIHKTCRVASSKATPSNATPSNATPSDAAKESLDGIIYDAVRMGNDSAAAFATTLNDVGITADGHFTECEAECSGRDCECGCHAVAHTLVADIEGLLAEVRTYDENTSTDIMFAAYDKLFGPLPDSIEKAYDNGELSDAEHAYVYEVFDASGMEIMEIFQKLGFDPYAANTMDLSKVTSAEAKNVNVKIFNYDNTVNTRADGLGPKGYSFFQGDYKVNNEAADDRYSVNGAYAGDADVYNKNNHPVMSKMLVNGYPYVASKADTSTLDISGSMKYLFDAGGKYHKGTMTDGGGLFQWDGDGYYYDSAENAARFNGTNFILYEEIIRPIYQSLSLSNVTNGNFLPFNNPNNSRQLTDTDGNPEKSPNGEDAYQLTEDTDLWFGMTVDFPFLMPKDGLVVKDSGETAKMVFDFHGDDDVFVYIDDVLVLDIGGTHAAQTGTIDFTTGAVEDPSGTSTLKSLYTAAGKTGVEFDGETFADYSQHTLKFYYMERGGNISYCRLKFNMPTLPENSLTVTKEVTSEKENDVTNYLKDTLSYKFKVVKADVNGEPLEGTPLYIAEGETFDILENNKKVDTGTVGADGYFTLKSGQSAQFTGMTERGQALGCYNYVVLEELPENAAGQYGSVEYKVTEQGGSSAVEGEQSEPEKFNTVQTGKLSAEKVQYVVYNNKIDTDLLSTLRVTKEKTADSVFNDDQTFKIQIKLGDKPLPEGTQYRVGTITRDVELINVGGETVSVIELAVGETAEILTGIIADTTYEVSEYDTTNAGFKPGYSAVVSSTDQIFVQPVVDATKVTGTFTPADVVHVTVTNAYNKPAEIVLNKTTTGFGDEEERTFNFIIEECDSEGNVEDDGIHYNSTPITIKGDGKQTGKITIGYANSVADETHYYKISEEIISPSNIIFDDTEYVVKVIVENGEASLDSVWTLTGDADNPLKAYNETALDFTNVNSTSITINKLVTGNMADHNKEFEFKVELSDPDGKLKDSIYVFENPGNSTLSNETTIYLRHGGTETLEKLPVGATITVAETESDYKVSYKISETKVNAREATEIIPVNGLVIDFINNKTADIDTGILLDSMPYVLILAAVAAGIAFYFIRKKKEDEDDFE